jgi:hypothetical protein
MHRVPDLGSARGILDPTGRQQAGDRLRGAVSDGIQLVRALQPINEAFQERGRGHTPGLPEAVVNETKRVRPARPRKDNSATNSDKDEGVPDDDSDR